MRGSKRKRVQSKCLTSTNEATDTVANFEVTDVSPNFLNDTSVVATGDCAGLGCILDALPVLDL